jgi:ketosteroid isomerase-like protein
MTTTSEQNLAAAVAYYRGFEEKDREAIGRHLHPEVRLVSPLAQQSGKDAVVESAARLAAMLRGIAFRATFAAGDQVMLAYDLELPEPVGRQPAAVLMTFRDGRIAEIQLYYDPRPFERAMGSGAGVFR